MLRYALRRSLWSLLVVWMVLTVVFVMMFALGDPAVATLGTQAKQEQVVAFRRVHGLDQPLWRQYFGYLGVIDCARPTAPGFGSGRGCGLLQGNLGESLMLGESVREILWTRLPRTAFLGAMAMTMELVLGLGLGIIAAMRRNTWTDGGIMSLAFLGMSVPSFVLGLWALDLFAFRLGWFPVGGYGLGFFDHVRHAFLPALTLAVLGAATYARLMRSEMVEALRAPFVRTALAKGVSKTRAALWHAVPNAMLPVVTVAGMQLGSLVSGAIITETIFAWPGMGRLAVESMDSWDPPVVLGVVIVASLAVQLGNLIADLAVASLDPRVR